MMYIPSCTADSEPMETQGFFLSAGPHLNKFVTYVPCELNTCDLSVPYS